MNFTRLFVSKTVFGESLFPGAEQLGLHVAAEQSQVGGVQVALGGGDEHLRSVLLLEGQVLHLGAGAGGPRTLLPLVFLTQLLVKQLP